MAKKIKVILDLESGQFINAVNTAERRTSGFVDSIGGLRTAMTGLFAGIGISELVSFSKTAMQAFAEQEQAQARLAAGLRVIGEDSAGAMIRARQFASEIQSLTVYGDEAVLGVMALGASLGKLSGEDLESATKAAIGFSDALGIDLDASMTMIAKAAQGNFTALSRYGIIIDENKTRAENFAAVLDRGVSSFRISESLAQSSTGQLQQLKNAYSDLTEIIGEGLTKAIAKASNAAIGGAGGITEFNRANEKLISGNIEEAILNIASSITYLTGTLEKLGAVMKPVQGFFSAVAIPFKAGFNTPLSRPWEFFTQMPGMFGEAFNPVPAWNRGQSLTSASYRMSDAASQAYGARIGSDAAAQDAALLMHNLTQRLKEMANNAGGR